MFQQGLAPPLRQLSSGHAWEVLDSAAQPAITQACSRGREWGCLYCRGCLTDMNRALFKLHGLRLAPCRDTGSFSRCMVLPLLPTVMDARSRRFATPNPRDHTSTHSRTAARDARWSQLYVRSGSAYDSGRVHERRPCRQWAWGTWAWEGSRGKGDMRWAIDLDW